MKVLKLISHVDKKSRYNYSVNYADWDCIEGDTLIIEHATEDINFDLYDVVFVPFWKRVKNHQWLIKKAKDSSAKVVLFDNDSCYTSFDDAFYQGFDFIFYRCTDKNGCKPKCKSSWLPWSIDLSRFTPNFNGNGILFSCTVLDWAYPLRYKIDREVIKNKPLSGDNYCRALSNHAAAIHTDSHIVDQVRAKALEMAASGTQIISNRTKKMDFFFPDDLILYFEGIEDLKEIVDNFTPNVEIQKELRYHVSSKHNCYVRAKQIVDEIESIL